VEKIPYYGGYILYQSTLTYIYYCFFWMNFGLLLGYSVRPIKGDNDQKGYLVGTLLGMISSLRFILQGQNIRDILK